MEPLVERNVGNHPEMLEADLPAKKGRWVSAFHSKRIPASFRALKLICSLIYLGPTLACLS